MNYVNRVGIVSNRNATCTHVGITDGLYFFQVIFINDMVEFNKTIVKLFY